MKFNSALEKQAGSSFVIINGGIVPKQSLFRRGKSAESIGDNIHELF